MTQHDARTGATISPELIDLLREKFVLDWDGIHGVAHWSRVRNNGLMLAGRNGANARIVEYFAFLHDACRCNDGRDPEHGSRAALLARHIRKRYLDLDDGEFFILVTALDGHSDKHDHHDMTIKSCWDADRLDLARLGIKPDPSRLCTAEARDPLMIAHAGENARAWIKAHQASLAHAS